MSAPKNVFRQGVSVFMSNRLAVVGLSILIAFTLFSFVGPYVWVTEQQYSSLSDAYLPLIPASVGYGWGWVRSVGPVDGGRKDLNYYRFGCGDFGNDDRHDLGSNRGLYWWLG